MNQPATAELGPLLPEVGPKSTTRTDGGGSNYNCRAPITPSLIKQQNPMPIEYPKQPATGANFSRCFAGEREMVRMCHTKEALIRLRVTFACTRHGHTVCK